MLAFIIPMPHPDSVSDYNKVWSRLCNTLYSITRQTVDDYIVVISVSKAKDLPNYLEDKKEKLFFLETNKLQPLKKHNYGELWKDKAKRIQIAIEWTLKNHRVTHFYFIDSDDYVSYDLVNHLRNKTKPIIIIDSGILVDTQYGFFACDENMNLRSGSTVCVMCDFIKEKYKDDSWCVQHFGRHIKWRKYHNIVNIINNENSLVAYNLHNDNYVSNNCDNPDTCHHDIICITKKKLTQVLIDRFALNMEGQANW